MSTRESDSHVIARRKTYDGVTVIAWSDGYVTIDGRSIGRIYNREAMRLFMDDVSRYDHADAKLLIKAAKNASVNYPDSTILARRYMRQIAGPPLKENPVSARDWIFIGTGLLSAAAILIEIVRKVNASPAPLNASAGGGTPVLAPTPSPIDQIVTTNGQSVTVPLGQSVTVNLKLASPVAGYRVSDTAGSSVLSADPGGAVTSSTLFQQRWSALGSTGTETITYQALDSSGADLAGQTVSFTANVTPAAAS